jgi:hypothetical protein
LAIPKPKRVGYIVQKFINSCHSPIDIWQSLLSLALTSHGKAKIQARNIIALVLRKSCFQRRSCLCVVAGEVLRSAEITQYSLAQFSAIDVCGIYLLGSLKIPESRLIVARDQRLPSVGNVARRLERRARREPNNKKQPRQKMYSSHFIYFFSAD